MLTKIKSIIPVFSSQEYISIDKLKHIDDFKLPVVAGVLLMTPVLLFSLFFYVFIIPLDEKIETVSKNVKAEEAKFIKNKRLASNIKKKRVEYKELQDKLLIALDMLPKKSQIPDLLDNVSNAGLEAGLKFSKFQPMPERRKSIHTEVPSNFSAQATFSQLMDFLDNTGKMARIVDVKSLKISRSKENNDLLNVEGSILTYRFSEQKKKKVIVKK